MLTAWILVVMTTLGTQQSLATFPGTDAGLTACRAALQVHRQANPREAVACLPGMK